MFFYSIIAGDLMRKLVNDYLPGIEDQVNEYRSTFDNASNDHLNDYDDLSVRR